MKAIMCYLFLLCCIFSVKAQVIELDPANLKYSKTSFVQTGLNEFQLKINEEYAGQFSSNPIAYVKKNFDIQEFIASIESKNFDSFEVNFKSTKGFLNAFYDKKGNLVSTFQQFKDIYVPKEIRENLYSKYKGWSMVKNKYVASGKLDRIDKAEYRIRLERGKEHQNIKITPKVIMNSGVASN